MTNIKSVTNKLSREELRQLSSTEKIDYFCHLNEMPCVSNGNGKTGLSTLTINLPPCITCRRDAPCKKLCYATSGKMSIPNVVGGYYRNLRLYNEDPALFFSKCKSIIELTGLTWVRWFASGDFVTKDFTERVFKLAQEMPNVRFMAFTKRYEWINQILEMQDKPDNLGIVFSAWDYTWKVPNPFHLPIAYIEFVDNRLNPPIPEDAFECPGECSICHKCWGLTSSESVVFHQHGKGIKSKH